MIPFLNDSAREHCIYIKSHCACPGHIYQFLKVSTAPILQDVNASSVVGGVAQPLAMTLPADDCPSDVPLKRYILLCLQELQCFQVGEDLCCH